MKQVFFFSVLAFLLTIAACKQNKCGGVVCNNGGICENGECQCATGFTGTNCDLHTNPCDTIPCYYGGVCLNGVCNCPGHTSGVNCQILEAPSKMYITGVTVNHFHPTNISGIQWDADTDNSPADIYPVIKRNGVVIFNGYTDYPTYAYKPNANYDTQYSMPFQEDSIPITDITNPNYRFELWDYDGGGNPDDSMYGFNFTPYTGIDGFPGSFSYHDTTYYNDEFEFRINYSPYYEW